MRYLKNIEDFAIQCQNALGDNVNDIDLTGKIFIKGVCVDEILLTTLLPSRDKQGRIKVDELRVLP